MNYPEIIKQFIESIRNGDNVTLLTILEMGFDPNYYIERRNVAEFIATKLNNIEGMDLLLKAGLKLTNFSSLIEIARNSYFSEDRWNGKTMIDVLVENGVNINITNKNNRTVLWFFADKIGAIKFLESKGVDSQIRDCVNHETVYEYMEKRNNIVINEGVKYSS